MSSSSLVLASFFFGSVPTTCSAPCSLLGLWQRQIKRHCLLRIPLMPVFAIFMWIPVGQMSRVSSILQRGVLGPKQDECLAQRSRNAQLLKASGPSQKPHSQQPRHPGLSACPRCPSGAAQPGHQLSSHSRPEPACSLAVHWAEPAAVSRLAQLSPWACTRCSPAPGCPCYPWTAGGP